MSFQIHSLCTFIPIFFRNDGLGNSELQQSEVPSHRSLYSERETSVFPSDASHITDALDLLEDENPPESSSGYYWAPARVKRNETQPYDNTSERVHEN